MNLSEEQRLLVRAATASRDDTTAWGAWSTHPEARKTPASFQLLPKLYANLRRQGIKDAAIAQLRPAYLAAWMTNLRLLRALPPAATALQAQGIEFMGLKGVALLARYHRDVGARPMGDVDILVPERRFGDALQVLLALGWSPHSGEREAVDPRFAPPIQLMHADGVSIDLHCHMLREDHSPGADDAFWKRAERSEIEGVHLLVPAAADLLVHVCLHGTRGRDAIPHLRWIADAIAIVQDGSVDWDLVVESASKRGLGAPVFHALNDLVDNVGLAVPAATLDALRHAPTDPDALLIHGYAGTSSMGNPALRIRLHWAFLGRGIGSRRRGARLRAIPAYLAAWCRVDRWQEVPGALVKKAGRMVGHWFGWYRYPSLRPAKPAS